MKLKRIVSALMMGLMVMLALAENNYEVTSSSRLNVRKSPSSSAPILGTLSHGQKIEVLSFDKGWAKVKFNGRWGYVRGKYISPLSVTESITESPKDEIPKVETTEERNTAEPAPKQETIEVREIMEPEDNELGTPLCLGHSLNSNLSIYLTLQGGVGYSNYIWSDGSVNGTMSYSGDIVGQLYFENKVSFIPANWYSELALGYDKKGAANYGMDYIHARIYPFGYRIPISPINVVVKAGPTLGFALNEFDNRWSSDFQVGIGGGFQIEWKQFALGCNVEYDFTEVSSSCGQTLNNIAVLGTISYKFAKFGHKR